VDTLKLSHGWAVALVLWGVIARLIGILVGHHLFTSETGSPRDMNVYRQRKMTPLLKSLGIPQAGYHAFRHFNVSLLDTLRVPLKTIQERAGHALTGVFTLDVYGGTPEWDRNLEAARLAGAEIEKAVAKAISEAAEKSQNETNPDVVGSLTAIEGKGSGAEIS
jgi:integrase